jgi:hypothetical protein
MSRVCGILAEMNKLPIFQQDSHLELVETHDLIPVIAWPVNHRWRCKCYPLKGAELAGRYERTMVPFLDGFQPIHVWFLNLMLYDFVECIGLCLDICGSANFWIPGLDHFWITPLLSQKRVIDIFWPICFWIKLVIMVRAIWLEVRFLWMINTESVRWLGQTQLWITLDQ